jgi:hypothetical protein
MYNTQCSYQKKILYISIDSYNMNHFITLCDGISVVEKILHVDLITVAYRIQST